MEHFDPFLYQYIPKMKGLVKIHKCPIGLRLIAPFHSHPLANLHKHSNTSGMLHIQYKLYKTCVIIKNGNSMELKYYARY